MKKITREIKPVMYSVIRSRVRELIENFRGEILYEEKEKLYGPFEKTDFIVANLNGGYTLVFNGCLNGRETKFDLILSGGNGEERVEQGIESIINLCEPAEKPAN